MGCGASRTNGPVAVQAGATAAVVVEDKTQSSKPNKDFFDAPDLSGTALVKAWPAKADGTVCIPEIEDPDFGIPALISEKLPLAICISGGGFRAATLGLGWLRGLHNLGVLEKAQYLVTCSGSSWLASALCFQRVTSTDAFLGPYLAPDQCDLEKLENVGPKGRTAASVMADAEPMYDYFKEVAGGLFAREEDATKRARAWTKAITAAFLEPYELGDTDTSTVTCCGTKVMVLAHERIIYYPLEWTPLYSGCPVRHSETRPKLGAGWVETMGLNALLVGEPEPTSCPTGAVHVRVRACGPASLGEATGISSSYISMQQAMARKKAPRILGFNTAQYFDLQEWHCSNVELSDGGAVDYHAIYPALRRRVPSIIVCSATRTEVDDPTFASYMMELAGMFGCWPGQPEAPEPNLEEYNKMQQVFPSEGWSELCQALRDSNQAGLPPVHVNEYEVMSNSSLGISGGWRVRVMWVINQRQPVWEAALPQATRERLESDRKGLIAKVEEALNPLDADTLRMFPHVSTFSMNYTPQLVGMMSNHAAYMMMSSKSAVQGMVAAAEAARAAKAEAAKEEAKGGTKGGGEAEVVKARGPQNEVV
ncbi:hypothetical protein VOLCADRAFT_91267 [Volvox carteri f. nagariensis]|uniref:PLA2c domain-containing protein n=1 Tax=Volvox carteri f. nagariensis TaxID=3068 RepID=D8TWL4_VOLCA|nr:uncharacterized protein VOLCADRAFT_91267 [Volvox carteri f. nagariensis]EFJ48069.1 hypothetical protein VOLCADRAFT_91267 [Volvox carteri f. nagariensis]|eukprot:XP_002950754.1 hypothetical protein VOLCADRAFT_91267 [Volvox carteri f. nagariensis]